MMRARKREERMNQGRQQSLLLSFGTLSIAEQPFPTVPVIVKSSKL
jgi:hypothetical protein